MKIFFPMLASLLLFAWTKPSPDRSFTGSTPAGREVKTFLGIPLNDSVDFIRWKMVIHADNNYDLSVNYGIGKPNTPGFYDGGKKMDFSGTYKKEDHIYAFRHGFYTLNMVELNADLLHFSGSDKKLLIGTGGFSYALNNVKPAVSDQVNIVAFPTTMRDSIAYVGRTPCGVEGVNKSSQCYKLKWSLVLYADAKKNQPLTYKVRGTGIPDNAGQRGSWQIMTGREGRIIYQLNDGKGNGLFYLLKLDEGVLIFTNKEGRLLVGDEDFSYTLNRK
ncbi:MAG TPA: hypothetical protein VLJ68_12885 [Chitinophagaceae bacterium]|nr:hypothetical protein [Chitinophagaceae bacterium]